LAWDRHRRGVRVERRLTGTNLQSESCCGKSRCSGGHFSSQSPPPEAGPSVARLESGVRTEQCRNKLSGRAPCRDCANFDRKVSVSWPHDAPRNTKRVIVAASTSVLTMKVGISSHYPRSTKCAIFTSFGTFPLAPTTSIPYRGLSASFATRARPATSKVRRVLRLASRTDF
jgi:hypothetical protein